MSRVVKVSMQASDRVLKLWPYISYFTSLGLHFTIYRMGITVTPISQDFQEASIKVLAHAKFSMHVTETSVEY